MLKKGARIVVAISGGADSVALLHALVELNNRHRPGWRLHAAHFNHRLRGAEADDDERFVRRFAARLKVPLTVRRAKTPVTGAHGRGAPGGIRVAEDELRTARYGFLYEVARKEGARFVATAHTLDDQAETVLMRIIRGAGIRGLAAMRAKRPLFPFLTGREKAPAKYRSPAVWLVRPFLGIRREEILQYLKEAGIDFREDSSNRDIRYTRNFVRARIVPLLRELNPAVSRALYDLATSARQFSDFVDFAASEAARFVLPKRSKDRTLLKVCDLKRLHPAVRTVVIEREIERLSDGEFTSVHRAAIESLISDTAGTKVLELGGGLHARRVYGVLSLEKAGKPRGTATCAHSNGAASANGTPDAEAMPPVIVKVPGTTTLPTAAISIRASLLSGREAARVVSAILGRTRASGRSEFARRARCARGNIPAAAQDAFAALSAGPAVPVTEYMDADRLQFPLTVRTWRAGDRFRPLGQRWAKKLQDCFVDRKVPRESRTAIPLVCSGHEIVWVAGLGIADTVKLAPRTKRVLRLQPITR